MNKFCQWVAISYNVPANPSKNRVYIWRKLKELGAAYLKQGVAILPNTKVNTEKFLPLADKIKAMGGEAVLLEMRFIEANDNDEMARFFMSQTEQEYNQLMCDCKTVVQDLKMMANPMTDKLATRLKNMVKRYNSVKERNYFSIDISKDIDEGFEEIMDTLRGSASDLSYQFKRMLDK